MRLIRPSVELLWTTPEVNRVIEFAGRTCYKSEDKITPDSAEKFIKMLIKRGHEAMLEHASMSMRFVCDRGVTHEIVRHRLASYAQESTRYCNYSGGVTFIIPNWLPSILEGTYKEEIECEDKAYQHWFNHMLWSERVYLRQLKEGWIPQQARSALPNSLKTEIVMTCNMREWRHFFELRCAKAAHPQMQEVANMALGWAQSQSIVLFEEYNA